MVALSSVDPQTLGDVAKARRVEQALRSLPMNDADFKNAIGTGTNGKGAISIRIQKARDAVAAGLSA